MPNQSVWIGITIGVFFVGLLAGYVALQSSTPSMAIMDSEQIQQMISNPEHVKQMEKMMQEDHEFMTQMMQVWMNNPDLRLQMMGHMTENPEMIEYMKSMMGDDHMTPKKMSPQGFCQSNGGNWLPEFIECEGISSDQCKVIGGEFKECESACRHDPKAEVCTLQCVPVCVMP